MKTVRALLATVFFLYHMVATSISTSCSPGTYMEFESGSCRLCSSCAVVGKVVDKECTETTDTACHSKCANPQYIIDDLDYRCRPVRESDCRKANLHCKAMDGDCECRIVSQDRQKVDCVCLTEPPTTEQLLQTELATTQHFKLETRKTSAWVTPTLRVDGNFAEDEPGDRSGASGVVVGLGVLSGSVCIVLCVVVWYVRRHRVTSRQGWTARTSSSEVTPSGSELGLVLNSRSERPHGDNEGIPEASHGGSVEIRHNSTAIGNGQGRVKDSPVATVAVCKGVDFIGAKVEVRPVMSCSGKGSVMARDVFENYHDKGHLIDLLGQFHGGCQSWKMVASHLGYSDCDIKSIEGNSVQRQRAAEILYDQWVGQSSATVGRLIGAARLANRDDIVRFILNLCSKRGCDNPELGTKETML